MELSSWLEGSSSDDAIKVPNRRSKGSILAELL